MEKLKSIKVDLEVDEIEQGLRITEMIITV